MIEQLDRTVQKNGITLTRFTGHSTFAVTHPNMYNFIASRESIIKKETQFETSLIALVNTKELFSEILQWWIRCSVTRDCIAPFGRTGRCQFRDAFTSYAECHRYDQSALNLLLLHHFDKDPNKFKGDCCSSANLWATFLYGKSVKICKAHNATVKGG